MSITDAVIPVAGLGTRLLPATKSQPKEMLPLVDRPVVQRVVEELAAAGVRRVLLVTGRRKRAIEDHFDVDPELEAALPAGTVLDPRAGLEVYYTRQPRPLGLGDALRCAATFAGDRPVVVALGDTVITGEVVRRMIGAQARSGADAVLAVEEVSPDAVSRYGIVSAGEDGEVSAVVEKPDPAHAPGRLAVAARYVLGPAVFAALRDAPPDARGEVQVADALRAVIAGGGRVLAERLVPGERRLDIGSVESYCSAFVELALADPRVGPALRERLRVLLADG
ncbi:MAG TPA: UTP--glucose-1-phosphate uridylyltransferase [Solirubrobacteraceae bacterium]|nr:UTP--glucose-1-phosphate uridylyltransferase [Solirubrobacteraceae bacterium]